MKKEFITRKYLVLEPHIDDFEIAMSVWLKKQAQFPTDIYLITLCNGRENQDAVSRTRKREENIKIFSELYPNITIHWYSVGYSDLTLENINTSKLITSVEQTLQTAGLSGLDALNGFKEIYIPQADNHPDHTKCNSLGKILTRNYRGKVFEFVIQNSQFMANGTFNTQVRTQYKFADKKDNERYIDCCLFPSEKSAFQFILYAQKGYDGKYIGDKFNLIRDIFVVGE